MRRRPSAALVATVAVAVAVAGLVGGCGGGDDVSDTEAADVADATAAALAGVTAPPGWEVDATEPAVDDLELRDVAGVPVMFGADHSVSISLLSPELDAADFPAGCAAVDDYLTRAAAALDTMIGGATYPFDADQCVASLATTTSDGTPISDDSTLNIWADGIDGDGGRYIAGIARIGGAGDHPRRLNLVIGLQPG